MGVGLALLGRLHVPIDQDDVDPGVRRDVGDARAHEAGAENADFAELAFRNPFGASGTLVQLAHGQEQ